MVEKKVSNKDKKTKASTALNQSQVHNSNQNIFLTESWKNDVFGYSSPRALNITVDDPTTMIIANADRSGKRDRAANNLNKSHTKVSEYSFSNAGSSNSKAKSKSKKSKQ